MLLLLSLAGFTHLIWFKITCPDVHQYYAMVHTSGFFGSSTENGELILSQDTVFFLYHGLAHFTKNNFSGFLCFTVNSVQFAPCVFSSSN